MKIHYIIHCLMPSMIHDFHCCYAIVDIFQWCLMALCLSFWIIFNCMFIFLLQHYSPFFLLHTPLFFSNANLLYCAILSSFFSFCRCCWYFFTFWLLVIKNPDSLEKWKLSLILITIHLVKCFRALSGACFTHFLLIDFHLFSFFSCDLP